MTIVVSGAVCGLVVLVFAGLRWLSVWLGSPAWANPVLATAIVIAGGMMLLEVPLADFEAASAPLRWMLGPAIVALAVVADGARPLLRGRGRAVLLAIVLGTLVGLGTALGAAAALGLGAELRAAVAAKSISGPFIYAILSGEDGPVALAAALSVLTGTIGAVCVPPLYRLLRMGGEPDRAGRALGLGVSAHLVGSEYAVRRDPEQGGLAIIALVCAGLMAAMFLPWLWRWLIGS
jgi:putative effector of murein hydrolase